MVFLDEPTIGMDVVVKEQVRAFLRDQVTRCGRTVLLAGALAPVWYFPGWFQRADAFLPFQATLNVPLSLYVGRLPAGTALREAALQAAWAAGLAAFAWWLWRRAAARLTVLGG